MGDGVAVVPGPRGTPVACGVAVAVGLGAVGLGAGVATGLVVGDAGSAALDLDPSVRNPRAGSCRPSTNACSESRRESMRQSFVTRSPPLIVVTVWWNHANPMTSAFSGLASPSNRLLTHCGFLPPISEAPISASRIGLSVISRSWSSDASYVYSNVGVWSDRYGGR